MMPLMIFAAGFGTRMGALTAHRPKPLIPVAGRPMIDRALDIGRQAGCAPVVVNTHYLAEMIAAHLAGTGVAIAHELGTILETGGGLRAARPLLGASPVMVLNPDGVFSGPNPLKDLAAAWDPARMDVLLLTLPLAGIAPPPAKGDFVQNPDGRLTRGQGGEDHIYIGAHITRTDGLDAIDAQVFSLNRLWDLAAAQGRLFGLSYTGRWCDVGRPEGITQAEAMLADAVT
jgi:N-acetyl-alpha-D-muramate 1-phosphate uridylyltransferase